MEMTYSRGHENNTHQRTGDKTTRGLRPLEHRQNIKVLTQAARLKRLRSLPMNLRMCRPPKGRFDGSSLQMRPCDTVQMTREHLPQHCAECPEVTG